MKHRQEPINFNRDGGIADVFTGRLLLDGTIGIDEQLTLRIKNDEERDTHGFAAKIGEEFFTAGAIQFWMLAALFENMEGGEDKILFKDRTNFPVSHEGIHLVARRTPGGAEDEENRFMLRNSVGLGGGQDLLGAWGLLGSMGGDGQHQRQHEQ